MVIDKILKELTPERVEKDREEVLKIELPPDFSRWVKEYSEFGESNRNIYFWQWLYRTVRTITFPSVIKKYQKSIWSVKLLILLFVTLFDDISDKYKTRNKKLLNEMIKIHFGRDYIRFNKLNQKEKKHINFTIKVWQRINKDIKRYPNYKYLKDIFEYDVAQLINAMEYAYLVNNNLYLINKKEYWAYLPHNMQTFLSLDIDLMCSPRFDFEKLGIFREIAWNAQEMARIGNWVSTWEREVEEKDFTSGVFAYAIDSGILSIDELKKGKKSEIIKKIKSSKITRDFLKRWEQCYLEIYKLGKRVDSVYIKEFLLGLKKLIFYHLSSRGYK